VFGSTVGTGGCAQWLFSRWSLVVKLITITLRGLAKYRIWWVGPAAHLMSGAAMESA